MRSFFSVLWLTLYRSQAKRDVSEITSFGTFRLVRVRSGDVYDLPEFFIAIIFREKYTYQKFVQFSRKFPKIFSIIRIFFLKNFRYFVTFRSQLFSSRFTIPPKFLLKIHPTHLQILQNFCDKKYTKTLSIYSNYRS